MNQVRPCRTWFRVWFEPGSLSEPGSSLKRFVHTPGACDERHAKCLPCTTSPRARSRRNTFSVTRATTQPAFGSWPSSSERDSSFATSSASCRPTTTCSAHSRTSATRSTSSTVAMQQRSTSATGGGGTSLIRLSRGSRFETETHLVQLPRYIALNPREYETWPYSSYPGMIGLREPFSSVDPGPIIETSGSVAAFKAYVDEGRAAEDANLVPASPATRFGGTTTGSKARPAA